MHNRVSYLLVKCSSKPLLVLSALLMNSSHIELEVEFRVVSSSSLPVNTPSRRALLLLPSKTWTEEREREWEEVLELGEAGARTQIC